MKTHFLVIKLYTLSITCLLFVYFHPLQAQNKPDNGALNASSIPKNFEVQTNLTYKTIADQKLSFDLIQLKEAPKAPAPLLIFIHGGGWRGGSKEAFYRHLFFASALPLMQKGMKVVTINYRLAEKNGPTTLASVKDCKDAVRFFASNAKKFNVDAKRFILMGGSAGGHLTLMTALAADEDYPPEVPLLNEKIHQLLAAVPFYPLCHFGDPSIMKGSLYGKPGRFDTMLGGPIETKRNLARQLSPIHLLNKNAPPLFLLHGDADTVLPVLSVRLFVEKARKVGARVTYLEVKNGNHGFRTADDPKLDGIIQQVTAYLDEKVYGDE